MHGLPFNVTNEDLIEFFAKKPTRAIEIRAETETACATFHSIADAAVACNLVVLLNLSQGVSGNLFF